MATMSARYTVIDGEVVAQERGGVRHQLVPDPLGSTVALYDDSGTKTDTFSYWPYGESSGRTGTTTAKFQYNGKNRYLKENNYYYVYSRILFSTKGSWITEDMIVPEINKTSNRFRYVYNNPVTYTDYFGLFSIKDIPKLPGFSPGTIWPGLMPKNPGLPGCITDPSWGWGHICNYLPRAWPWSVHGNYCGLCSGGFANWDPSSGKWIPQDPVDGLDIGCQKHDECLGSPDLYKNWGNQLRCNCKLCNDARDCFWGNSRCKKGCGFRCKYAAAQIMALYCPYCTNEWKI
jgi:RHS repeat-associated protein